jgi:hypothetical protein
VQGGDHQVLQHLDLVGIDDLGGDRHPLDLTRPTHRHLDHPAAGRAFDHLVGGLGLGGQGLLGGLQ